MAKYIYCLRINRSCAIDNAFYFVNNCQQTQSVSITITDLLSRHIISMI